MYIHPKMSESLLVTKNKLVAMQKIISEQTESITHSEMDQKYIRTLSNEKQLEFCKKFIDYHDESIRNEVIWIMQDLIKEYPQNHEKRKELENMGAWLLLNDNNAHIRHEACFILIRSGNPENSHVLAYAALRDPVALVRHEATEVLGEMLDERYFWVIEKNTHDDPSVSVTANLMKKRIMRIKKYTKTQWDNHIQKQKDMLTSNVLL